METLERGKRTRLAIVEPILMSLALSLGHCMVVVVVAVAERVVGAGSNIVSGGLRIEGWKKTNHDFHRGSLSGHTGWASHCLCLLGVSPSSIPHPPPFPASSELAPPTSLWKGEGQVQ